MKRQIAVPSLSSPARREEGKGGGEGGEEGVGVVAGSALGRPCFVGGNNWRDSYQTIPLQSC